MAGAVVLVLYLLGLMIYDSAVQLHEDLPRPCAQAALWSTDWTRIFQYPCPAARGFSHVTPAARACSRGPPWARRIFWGGRHIMKKVVLYWKKTSEDETWARQFAGEDTQLVQEF